MNSQILANYNAFPNAKGKKIPRPLNCFMTYRLEKQREIVNRCPGANHRDISKIIAKWWKELSPEDKEPYRIKAELARAEHRKLYPGYKFCPKKKLSKPRAYKKRPENQFTARDQEDEQELYRLYHDGKNITLPADGERFPLLLDTKEPKVSTKSQNQKKNVLEPKEYHQSCYTGYPDRLLSLSEHQLASSPYNTGLLYPPIHTGSLLYPQSIYSPSASPYTVAQSPYIAAHSPSASSYTTGYYSSSEEPASQEVNYDIYSSQYRYEGTSTLVPPYTYYSSPAHYYSSPVAYYYNASSPVYDDRSCSPKSPQDTCIDDAPSAAPSLLTSAFYYQQ